MVSRIHRWSLAPSLIYLFFSSTYLRHVTRVSEQTENERISAEEREKTKMARCEGHLDYKNWKKKMTSRFLARTSANALPKYSYLKRFTCVSYEIYQCVCRWLLDRVQNRWKVKDLINPCCRRTQERDDTVKFIEMLLMLWVTDGAIGQVTNDYRRRLFPRTGHRDNYKTKLEYG